MQHSIGFTFSSRADMNFEVLGPRRCFDAGSSWSVRLKLRFLVLGAADNILILRAADRLNTCLGL